MPRGRPKKQPVEVEILSPEETDQPRVVNIKHKTEWIEARPVEETEDAEEFDGDDEIVEKPKRKTQSERERIRKRLRSNGVSPASSLTLTIEKYVHSESVESGMWADREFCTKYACTEEHALNEAYMDVLKKWGSGTYRITLRFNGTIVDAFDKRMAAAPVIQHAIPGDPTSPQVIVQSPGDGQSQQPYQPMSMKDIMRSQKEALKEHLEMTTLMREAYGFTPEQPANQSKSEEEILTSAILKQPEMLENVVGSVMKRFGGKGGTDDEPWYADIVRDAVKSGQAAQVVKTAIDSVFNGVSGLFPKGANNNGQAQVAETQQPVNQAPQPAGPMHQDQMHQITGEQHIAGLPPTQANEQAPIQGHHETGQPATPEEQALGLLIDHCRRQIPPKIAFDRLINYADAVNEQAPHLSIDGYIDMLGSAPTDAVIEYVKTLPGGEQIASLPHAAEWTAELQKLIKDSQEGEEE